MATRKRAAPANRRATSAKAILSHIPHSTARGGMNFRSVANMPAVRYIAGGLALYGLVRLAVKSLGGIPQIGEFFSGNLETVEDKFRTWTGRDSAEMTESAH